MPVNFIFVSIGWLVDKFVTDKSWQWTEKLVHTMFFCQIHVTPMIHFKWTSERGVKTPTPHQPHFVFQHVAVVTAQFFLFKSRLPHLPSGSVVKSLLCASRTDILHSVDALLSQCVLRWQYSRRNVVVCSYTTQTLRTSITLWFGGCRRLTLFTGSEPKDDPITR